MKNTPLGESMEEIGKLANQIEAVSFLIETASTEVAWPEEICHGLGQLLSKLAQQIRTLAQEGFEELVQSGYFEPGKERENG